MAYLTAMDVQALIDEPSVQVRSNLASKIASDYRFDHFTPAESAVATEIFRILIKDAENKVRAALAEQLAHSARVPHDIILQLANDESEIARYVLEYSYVLTEDDLIAIVRSTKEVMKLCAIARRDTLSQRLSGSLLDTGDEAVMQDLFANQGAALDIAHLQRSWAFISARPNLLETLVHHGGLPLAIAEKIFFIVSDDLKRQLARRYKELNAPFVHKAVSDVREWQMLGVAPANPSADLNDDEQVENLVDELHMNARLTHSLLMRALCMGNLGLFEAGIAKLAGVARVNARILLMDAGERGFGAIYKAAHMPEGFCEAIQVLLRISLEETQFGHIRPIDFRKRVIDRLYMEKHVHNVENMEYMLTIIGGRIAAPADVH